MFSKNDIVCTKNDLVKLWIHESQRVYYDKLIQKKDMDTFLKILGDVTVKCKLMTEQEFSEYRILPYSHFAHGTGDPKYSAIKNFKDLQRLLNTALDSYNDELSAMNLVLFQDAMEHM